MVNVMLDIQQKLEKIDKLLTLGDKEKAALEVKTLNSRLNEYTEETYEYDGFEERGDQPSSAVT